MINPTALDHFSNGEMHRLGLLRAWLRDRPIEDEPTAFLDQEAARMVRSIIEERMRHKLVLISSHDPELMGMAGQIIRLQVEDRDEAETIHSQTSDAR